VEQVLIHTQLSNCESLSHIITDAGSQRMLSQRITKDVLLLSNPIDQDSDSKYLQELKESVSTLEKAHMELYLGSSCW
jgi:nitrate/nitrite-specific signal transduction histidine kinase